MCQELQRCWVFHAQQFPVYIKDGPPPKGHPANGRPVVENGSLMKEAKRRLTRIVQSNRRATLTAAYCSGLLSHQIPI
ncbi:UNVERIFIED_CONTAM: hypothetical protein FKN15_061132 [Acipenser sinensis]